jgi:hypothetical protein
MSSGQLIASNTDNDNYADISGRTAPIEAKDIEGM